MWFQGKVPFLFWHFALFAPAPCPFEILAGALGCICVCVGGGGGGGGGGRSGKVLPEHFVVADLFFL